MSIGNAAASYTSGSVGGGATSTYSAEVLADAPLLYWRLGESSGPAVVDSSGNGRDGVYAGSPTLGVPSLASAETDTAVYLNNVTGDYAYIASAAWMNVTDVTVTFLARVAPIGLRMLVSRYYDTNNDRSWFVCTDGNLFKAYFQNNSGGGTWVSTTMPAQLGVTYFVAAYSNAAGSGIRVYTKDGLYDQATAAGQAVNSSSRSLRVGRSEDGASYQVEAYIDEVAFYGSVLPTARLDALAALAVGAQPKWLNFTSGISPRNGTNDHTLIFPATAAHSLVVAVLACTNAGIASYSHGWTQRVVQYGDFSELTVLTRRANSGETNLQVSYDNPDHAINYAIYEFPTGSRWHSSVSQSAAPPTLTGLPATTKTVVLATCVPRYNPGDAPTSATWTYHPFAEDCDLMSDIPGGNGIFLTTGHCDLLLGTSASPNRNIWNGGAPAQNIVFAVIVP